MMAPHVHLLRDMSTMVNETKSIAGFTVQVESFHRSPEIRSVNFTLPEVCADWGGLSFELVSYKGGDVEVYRLDRKSGIYMYQGRVADYLPGGCDHFRAIWRMFQPSAAARASFERSTIKK